MAEGADIVGRLARGGLMQRLLGPKRQPLRLAHVPRDHVEGDKRKGQALLGGVLVHGAEQLNLANLDFTTIGLETAAAKHLNGFAWLRDLAAATSREQGSRLGRSFGVSGSSSGPPTPPISCRAGTAAIDRPCSTRWHGVRAMSRAMPTALGPGLIALPPGPAPWSRR